MLRHMRIETDAGLCRDCQACLLACSLYHEGVCSPALARLAVTKDMARYEFDIRICLHCDEPECLAACPADAMSVNNRGVVAIEDELCIACGACADGCPHDAIFYHQSQGRYLKCDLCAGRAEGPLCARLCPVGALTVVNNGATGENA